MIFHSKALNNQRVTIPQRLSKCRGSQLEPCRAAGSRGQPRAAAGSRVAAGSAGMTWILRIALLEATFLGFFSGVGKYWRFSRWVDGSSILLVVVRRLDSRSRLKISECKKTVRVGRYFYVYNANIGFINPPPPGR